MEDLFWVNCRLRHLMAVLSGTCFPWLSQSSLPYINLCLYHKVCIVQRNAKQHWDLLLCSDDLQTNLGSLHSTLRNRPFNQKFKLKFIIFLKTLEQDTYNNISSLGPLHNFGLGPFTFIFEYNEWKSFSFDFSSVFGLTGISSTTCLKTPSKKVLAKLS